MVGKPFLRLLRFQVPGFVGIGSEFGKTPENGGLVREHCRKRLAKSAAPSARAVPIGASGNRSKRPNRQSSVLSASFWIR